MINNIGCYTFNKRGNKHNSHEFNDEEDIIRIKDGVPRIISDGQWEKVTKRFADNTKTARNAKENYLLTGVIKCGICGRPMTGHTTYNSKNVKYSSYICPNRRSPT